MSRLRTLVILVAIAMPLKTYARAAGGTNPAEDGVTHGTINVILANKNGIVALTDSMITEGSHQVPEAGQKLFKLDDRTVCTIAGFVKASGPIPDFHTSTSAIINDYVEQIAHKPQLSIREKLMSLAYLFQFQLTAIATFRAIGGWPTPATAYTFWLTIAGYDTDGVPRIGQIALSMVPSGDTLNSEIREDSITQVGGNLVTKLAGLHDVAEQLLSDPSSAGNDPAFATYAESVQRDGGQSLTLAQMTEIASALARRTAQVYREVGGADQVAILQDGHVARVVQASYPAPPTALHFNLMVKGTFSGPNALQIEGSTFLILRSSFSNDRRPLDGHFFYSDTFANSVLTYDGGGGYFDKNNKITNCLLILGPHAKRDDKEVRHLINHFQWTQGVYQEIVPPSPPPPAAPARQ
jgi:hypothetical protein